jgi:16S rRNA (guanine527-N7)-methyltransferase
MMNLVDLQLFFPVSDEAYGQLQHYAALLEKWQQKINLVGPDTLPHLWHRHIADGVQLAALVPAQAKHLADFGSGAGIPGLMVAACLPQLQVTLVERDRRKAVFLEEAVRVMGLKNTCVKCVDIAAVEGRFDVVTARALASLEVLCAHAYPRLSPTGICLFAKGATYAMEVASMQRAWHGQVTQHPSKTEAKAAVVSITELSPVQGSTPNQGRQA